MSTRDEKLKRLCELYLLAQEHGFDKTRLRMPQSTRLDDHETVCEIEFDQDDYGRIEITVRVAESVGVMEDADYFLDRAELFFNETLNHYLTQELSRDER